MLTFGLVLTNWCNQCQFANHILHFLHSIIILQYYFSLIYMFSLCILYSTQFLNKAAFCVANKRERTHCNIISVPFTDSPPRLSLLRARALHPAMLVAERFLWKKWQRGWPRLSSLSLSWRRWFVKKMQLFAPKMTSWRWGQFLLQC